jgi:hypothetical protein
MVRPYTGALNSHTTLQLSPYLAKSTPPAERARTSALIDHVSMPQAIQWYDPLNGIEFLQRWKSAPAANIKHPATAQGNPGPFFYACCLQLRCVA